MGTSYRVRIGLKEIEAMQPNTILWDTEVRGFVARRQHSDIITFSVVYRTKENVQRWQKLERYPILTPHLARQEAIKVLRAKALGEDPARARMALRHGMTVAELSDAYMDDVEKGRVGKKPATIRADKSRIKNHIKPKIGKIKISSITSDHVEAFMHSMKVGSQGRTIGLVGAMFSWAIKKKLCATNPCVGIEKPTDVKKTRRLSDVEYQQLGMALNGGGATSDVFLMLAISGWRSSEARLLKWSDVDLPRQVATLSDTKTGVSIRPLSGAAIEIINRQPKSDLYVFGDHGSISYAWRKLGMVADITQHTLRHSYASLAADMGLSDNSIATLLGHARKSVTSRYLHLGDKAAIENANLIASETLKLMNK